MLPAHVDKQEFIDRQSIWFVLIGLIDDCVVQVPRDIGRGLS